MKKIVILFCLLSFLPAMKSQNSEASVIETRKGYIYLFWGWNRSTYTNSDIRFHGVDYDFKLQSVDGNDRQTPFDIGIYLGPGKATIPQYNFRIGYFIRNNWDISIGFDHMKYVMVQDQTVKIAGSIENTNSEFNGNYNDVDIVLSEDFLKFEHTDGLNYIDVELRWNDSFFTKNWFSLEYSTGGGFGIMLPKTNTTLLSRDRYDEVNLAGFGLNTVIGLRANIGKSFFVQSEWKAGYINMPNIRTTQSSADNASQHFFYSALDIVFGISF